MAKLPRLEVAGQTDVGLKRKRNEDFYKILVPPANVPQADWGALFIVADGMGGMGGGDVASRSAVEELMRRYYGVKTRPDDLFAHLNASLESANAFVRKQAVQMGLPRIGTTAAGLLLTPAGEAVVFNVGDSRVYRVRGAAIEQLSRDQSIVAQQLASGLISEEEARNSDNPNLTSFLGQPFTITPAYSRAPTQPGDIFVMCSDGLWRLVSEEEIRGIVQNTSTQHAVQTLIQLGRERGGPDNLTVVVARIQTGAQAAAPRFAALAAVAAVIVLVAAAVLLAANSGAFRALSPDSTITETVTQTPDSVSPSAANQEPVLAVIASSTFTQTPEPTATATLTATSVPPTVTLTVSPTSTPTDTPTASPTGTFTPSPTMPHTATLRPTRTIPPTFTPTRTPSPTPTLTVEPSVTLDPTLAALGGTPEIRPTVAFNLILESARGPGGVVLTTKALLYPDPHASEGLGYLLQPGDAVQIIGGPVVVSEGNSEQTWWPVQVVNTRLRGWLPQPVLERASLNLPLDLPENVTLSPETTDAP